MKAMIKGVAAGGGGALAVVGISFGVLAIHQSGAATAKAADVGTASPSAHAATASAASSTTSTSPVPDQACSENATPGTSSNADPRITEAQQNNPASQASPSGSAMDRSMAVAAALTFATPSASSGAQAGAASADTDAPAAAVEVPWNTADEWMPGDASGMSLIAPSRCVWLVTVDAPFQPASPPEASNVPTYSSYTVMFDAASGQYLGLSAGKDTPNMLTGASVDTDN